MRSPLRALALLGTSTVASVLAAALTSKVYALRIDASGIGANALMQSVVGLAVLIGSIGIPAGLVRAVSAAARDGYEDARLSALRAARRVTLTGSAIVCTVLLIFWPQVARLAFGGGAGVGRWELGALGLAIIATTWASVDAAYLNGHHRIGDLARLGVYSSVASALIGISSVWLLGMHGLPAAILGSALVNAAITHVAFIRADVPRRGPAHGVWAATKELLHFGLPMTASGFLGTGIQMLMPVLVLHQLDRDSVGVYRAASSISVNYLGLLLTAMAQDYFPRATAARPEDLRSVMETQHRLLLLIGVPIVCVGALVSPVLIPILYKTGRFTAAVPILQWQLIGDLLRLSSWALSYVVLARSGSVAFFVMEALGGIGFVVTMWLGTRTFGLLGTGIGFVWGYAVYWLIAAAVLWRTQRVGLHVRSLGAVAGSAGLLVAVQLLEGRVSGVVVYGVRGILAAASVAFAAALLWREVAPRVRRRLSAPSADAPADPRT